VESPKKTRYGTQTDVVDLAELSETGWHCDSDGQWPMTAADTFDRFWAAIKELPPEVQNLISLYDPMNEERTLELIGLPGYESVTADQKRKTLDDIQRLLTEQATQQPGPDGQPQDQPSLPIDDYDDHQFVADFTRKWMVSEYRLAASNPTGFHNVFVWQQAHQAKVPPAAPPPPPPVRANLGLTAKLEDFPGLIPEVFQGAGLQVPPPGAQQPVPPPQPAPQPPSGGQQGGGGPEDLSEPVPAEDQVNPLNAAPPIPGPQAPAPIQ
jgi:hypothetical protein